MAWGDDEYRRDEDDDGEQEIDEADYKFQKDAVLFAIDISSSMLQRPPPSDDKKADTDSPILAALKCAYQIMQQRIISNPKDMMGVLLFGTEKTKFQDEVNGQQRSQVYPNVYLLNDLNVPEAEDIKRLKEMAEEGEDPEGILTTSDSPVSVSNLLHAAVYLFTTNCPNFGSRRLFIITDNDSPQGDDREEKSYAAVQAKDLFDIDARIELFPISRDGKKFDLTNFYDDIIYKNEEDVEVVNPMIKTSESGDGLTLLKSLISNINSKQVSKRALFSNLPFEVAPGLTISVKGYMPLHKQEPARTTYVYLDGEKPLLAQAETSKVEKSSGRALQQTEIVKGYMFGQELIDFKPEELKAMRQSFGDPVIRIIGFKPRTMLPSWASVKKSTFIYPSEEKYVGSTRVFSALWQKLLKSNKVGIAWYVARKNASPFLVAILASKHDDAQDPESGITFPSSGLWLYPLPYADDLREIQAGQGTKAPDELIDKMRPIIQNLQLPGAKYNPQKYPNPSLQWHYKILQSLALEEEMPEQEKHPDQTVPKYKQIDKRVGGYLHELKQGIAEAAGTLRDERATKRGAEGDTDERLAKRAKAGPSKKSAGPLSNAQLKTACEQDVLKKMLVADLKDNLASKGLSTSGLKAALVERLEQWIEENA